MRKSFLLLASLFAVACGDNQPMEPRATPDDASFHRSTAFDDKKPADEGIVYTLTNQSTNAVRAYRRNGNGALTLLGDFPTGGAGTAAGTGSASAITFAGDRFLVAVNPASNEITSFEITRSGLAPVSKVSSHGVNPISVSSSNNLVYVLNASGTANISGFRINPRGRLTPIPQSTRELGDGATVQPAQVSFDPWGTQLVVTEKGTNQLVTFTVGPNGRPGATSVTASAGATPFGFAFSNLGVLVVSEAFGGEPNASATSSYVFGFRGKLITRTSSLGAGQTAACWVATTPNSRYAYVANTGSNTLTGYRIGFSGTLSLLDDGVTAQTEGAPADIIVTPNGRFVYNVNGNSNSISGFAIAADGSLTPVGTTTGLPTGSVGILAR